MAKKEDVDWVPILRKITVEEEKGESASGKSVDKTTTTTRTWYRNKNVIISDEELEFVRSAPET